MPLAPPYDPEVPRLRSPSPDPGDRTRRLVIFFPGFDYAVFNWARFDSGRPNRARVSLGPDVLKKN